MKRKLKREFLYIVTIVVMFTIMLGMVAEVSGLRHQVNELEYKLEQQG